jgi:tetratricopeptide (TPR) repeat protein
VETVGKAARAVLPDRCRSSWVADRTSLAPHRAEPPARPLPSAPMPPWRLEADNPDPDSAGWRWRLYDADGTLAAHHSARPDPAAWEWHALKNLPAALAHQGDPDDPLQSAAALLERIGDYTATHILGPQVTETLADAAPVAVTVTVAADTVWLAGLPLGVARHRGRSLTRRRVALTTVVAPDPTTTVAVIVGAKRPVEGRLRVLAVYSLPAGQGLLDLRGERKTLTDLVALLGGQRGLGFDVRVLQYGATPEKLRDALDEDQGWDLVVVSGHGAPGRIWLETPTGQPVQVDTDQLTDWLHDARHRLKLVCLNACSTAAFTVTATRRNLGLQSTNDTDLVQQDPQAEAPQAAVSLAVAVADAARCPVIAMRYPIVDDYAIDYTRHLYDALWRLGHDIATAATYAAVQAAPTTPTPAAPPESLYTPAVYGATAPTTRLTPPAGDTTADTRLAAFPRQAERFVGRVPALTAAHGALAPRSGHGGVILHGMAGAGKTAIAVELAHDQRDNFAHHIWAKTPDDHPDGTGGDPLAATQTLTALTGDLDLALGTNLAAHPRDPAALAQLAEALRQKAVLVVVDNAESLLDGTGAWHDPTWQALVETIAANGGLSRVVVTTRRPPTPKPPDLDLLAVHALTGDETILLARRLPHLKTLLHDHQPATRHDTVVQADRALAVKILQATGGHPKLLELADAHLQHQPTLTAMLTAAATTWHRHHIDPAAYLSADTGTEGSVGTDNEPASGPADGDIVGGYLDLLQQWATQALDTLGPDALLLAQVLARLDDDDRARPVVDDNWADVWHRLQRPGDPPDPGPLLDQLAAAALTDTDTPNNVDTDGTEPEGSGWRVVYRVHPVVAATIAAATPDTVADAVDIELAAFWDTLLDHYLKEEQAGRAASEAVIVAARRAAHYHLRQHHWQTAQARLEQAVLRDQSPAGRAGDTAALQTIAQQLAGSPEELAALGVLAKAVADSDPARARRLLEDVETRAAAAGDHRLASVAVGDLVDLYRAEGRYQDALAAVDRLIAHSAAARLGPWTQLADQGRRLQILHLQGAHQYVLDQVGVIDTLLPGLDDPAANNETASPFNVREQLWETAGLAAIDLGHWEEALGYLAKQAASQQTRAAPALEQARAAFNTSQPLLELGRLDDADRLLESCRAICQAVHAYPLLASCLGAQGDLEHRLGHGPQALNLQHLALRFGYLQPDPENIAVSHHNLGLYLTQWGDDPAGGLAHRLAATLLAARTGSGNYRPILASLAQDLAAGTPAPGDYPALCAAVETVAGVAFGQLVDALGGDGPALHHQILDAARNTPPEQLYAEQIAAWDPTVALLAAAARGHPHATTRLHQHLDRRAEHGWGDLAEHLRRLAAHPDLDPAELVSGLDPVDTAIAARAHAAAHHQITVDPAPEWLRPLLDAVAAHHHTPNPDPATAIDNNLEQLAQAQSWSDLAAQLANLHHRRPVDWEALDPLGTAIIIDLTDRLDQPPPAP